MKLANFLLCALAACLVALYFSGCSGSNVTKITMLNMKIEQTEALQKAINEYKKVNDDAEIVLETYGGSQDHHVPLKAKMQSDPPVIFPLTGINDLYDYMETIDDLNDQNCISLCQSSVTQDVTVDGKIYGIPITIEGYGYLVNTKMFESAGVDVMSMYTFEGMKAGFTKLKQKIDSGSLKSEFPELKAVFAMPAKETWVIGEHAIAPILQKDFANAKETFAAKTIPFKGAELYKQMIDFQVSFTDCSNNPSALTSVDYAAALNQGFLMGKYAVIQQGNWIESLVKNQDPDMLDDIDMIPYNVPDGSTDGKFVVGSSGYWAVNKNASEDQIALAKDFLNWLYTSDEGKYILTKDANFILPTGYAEVKGLSKFHKRIYDAFKSGDSIPFPLINAVPTSWSQNVAGANVQNYLSGGDWNSLIDNMKNRWQEIRAIKN